MRECVATFERVLIPMGRVFLSGDTTRCNSILEQTGLASVLKEQRALKAAIAAEVATRNRG
jgi:aromatic ring hydroxylase